MIKPNCLLEYLPPFYVRIPGRTRFDYEFVSSECRGDAFSRLTRSSESATRRYCMEACLITAAL
jgi:hypothetical protein